MTVVFVLGVGQSAGATLISFVQYASDGDTLQGIDGNTSGWSLSDGMVNLSDTWSLLGDTALVSAYSNDSGILTHRGTRGLGVAGQENDEVDSYNYFEKIEITFDIPHWLSYLEVRSLFYEPNLWEPDSIEEGDVDFYLAGSKFHNEHLVGWQDIRDGTKGIVSVVPDEPKLIDKLVFYVQQNQSYTSESEFAVAKLEVAPIPEPATMLLLGCLATGLFGIAAVKKKQ